MIAWPTHIVAAAGYVFNKNGNILLVKTNTRGWDCTGGQIEVGESVEDGVLREVLEESGVKRRFGAWLAFTPMSVLICGMTERQLFLRKSCLTLFVIISRASLPRQMKQAK